MVQQTSDPCANCNSCLGDHLPVNLIANLLSLPLELDKSVLGVAHVPIAARPLCRYSSQERKTVLGADSRSDTVFCQNVEGEDELCWSARVTDISLGGKRLLSPHKFEPATVVRIGRADGREESLRLMEALVVRAERPPGKKWTLGFAFTKELSEAELLGWMDEAANAAGRRQDFGGALTTRTDECPYSR